jgi:hypothetical protein
MSEANEANVHVSLLLLPSILVGYAASTPNNTPIFLHATSRSLTLRVMPREFCRSRCRSHLQSQPSPRSAASAQFTEHFLRLFQIARVEPFRKPAVNRSQQFARFSGVAGFRAGFIPALAGLADGK